MKQGSCSIFCAGAVTSHWDSALFQKVGAIGLRTGSLSSIDVICPSPRAPLEFPHSWLSYASTSPRGMILKNLLGIVERRRSFFWTSSGLDRTVVPDCQEPWNPLPILSRGWRGTSESATDAVCWSASTLSVGTGWKPWSITILMWNCLSLEDTHLTSKLSKVLKVLRAAIFLRNLGGLVAMLS